MKVRLFLMPFSLRMKKVKQKIWTLSMNILVRNLTKMGIVWSLLVFRSISTGMALGFRPKLNGLS